MRHLSILLASLCFSQLAWAENPLDNIDVGTVSAQDADKSKESVKKEAPSTDKAATVKDQKSGKKGKRGKNRKGRKNKTKRAKKNKSKKK